MNQKLNAAVWVIAGAFFVFAPAAYSEGPLAASSEATCINGFPVITGPGATVLTPSGAYVMEGAGRPVQRTAAAVNHTTITHPVECQIRTYKWPARSNQRLAYVRKQAM